MTYLKLISNLRDGEFHAAGQTSRRIGDPGAMYGVRFRANKYQVVYRPMDNLGLYQVEAEYTDAHAAWRAARAECDSAYR